VAKNRTARPATPRLRGAGARRVAVVALVLLSLAILIFAWSRRDARKAAAVATPILKPAEPSTGEPLSEAELQSAADSLLAAVNPHLAENAHFPHYGSEKLDWMQREVGAGRLTVAFLFDPDSIRLPAGVLMAASRLDGQPTIFIVKPRFETFLREQGRTAAPFTLRQKNDFAIGLIHEIDHLQNTTGIPKDPGAFFQEESRAWREVNLGFVRPLRALNQPIDDEFVQVDEALRCCGDELPCPQLARLVRLTR
jgi:hypothetical protein